jgi:hypothetical protein
MKWDPLEENELIISPPTSKRRNPRFVNWLLARGILKDDEQAEYFLIAAVGLLILCIAGIWFSIVLQSHGIHTGNPKSLLQKS